MKSSLFVRSLFGVFCAVLTAGSAANAFDVTLRLVVLNAPSAGDLSATLPTSVATLDESQSYVCELWAQTTNTDGFGSVSADIAFDPLLVSVGSITPTALFNLFTNGTIDNFLGTVDDLSGSVDPSAHSGCGDQIGASGWARVAILNMTALDAGATIMKTEDAASGLFGNAICNLVGNVVSSAVDFGDVSFTILPPVCGNGVVDTGLGEECDDSGESATCDADCTFAICGDGTINVTAGEECDDTNNDNTDLCLNNCQKNPASVPTVSEWGLIVMVLMAVAIGAVLYGRRRAAAH